VGAGDVVTDRAVSQEILALRRSLLLVILFAAGGILVAMYSDSETMSLEAMSAVVDIVVSGLAVFAARKVRAPANHRYRFGYAKYEPLMTTVEASSWPASARALSCTRRATSCTPTRCMTRGSSSSIPRRALSSP
jgi:hypothetical protein